uniref:Uncharacterized protein n=1 Tax=Anopheles merus TaxID=30066 RepID=A0A182V9H1_ANOME
MVSLYGAVVVGVVVVLVRIIVLASFREGCTRSGRARALGRYKSGPLIGRRAQSAEGYYRHHVVGSQFSGATPNQPEPVHALHPQYSRLDMVMECDP